MPSDKFLSRGHDDCFGQSRDHHQRSSCRPSANTSAADNPTLRFVKFQEVGIELQRIRVCESFLVVDGLPGDDVADG